MLDTLNFRVVKHIQKDVTCYMGHMTAEESAAITFADSYPPNPQEGRIGYQRPPDEKRGKDFGEYLRLHTASFLTPLLLNARVPLRFEPDMPNSDSGTLFVPNKVCIAKIDGQHRGIGVEKHLGDPSYPVPFMLFDNLDPELEQDLFITINREQRKVSMSHVLFVGREDDPLTSMVIQLESDPNSPWIHRVNLIGARGLGRPTSLQSLREGLEVLLSHGRVKGLSYEQQYQIARSFWNVVSEVWPFAWHNPRQHLLTKYIGMFALSQLGRELVPECLTAAGTAPEDVLDADALRKLLARAKTVDWSTDGEFQGIAGRGGAKVVKDRLDSIVFGHAGDGV